MNINRKEILQHIAGLGLAGAILGTVAWAPSEATISKPPVAVGQATSPLETPTPTPTVIPEKPRNPYANIVPLVVSNLRAGPFFQLFRKRVPKDTEVSITDFGPHRYAGTVVPEEGVKIRTLPDVNSEPASDVKWLDRGEQVGLEYIVTFWGKDQQLLERWMLIDEKERPGARWKCARGWHPGQGHCFAAMQIGDEVLIDFSNITPPPADEVKFYNWPAKPTSSVYDRHRIAPSRLIGGLQQHQLYGNRAPGYPNSHP